MFSDTNVKQLKNQEWATELHFQQFYAVYRVLNLGHG